MPSRAGTRARWLTAGVIGIVVATALVLALMPDEEDERPEILVGFSNNGVSQRVVSAERSAALIAQSGGEVDRVQIDWATLEPRPGVYDFALYDAIYRADLAVGVRPLFNFAFAPSWASDGECARGQGGCHAAPSTEHFDDAARTASAIARRYPRAIGIEIWNEPNAPYFWRPTPDPEAYSDLLKVTYAAIKEVDPAMPVAASSTSNSPGFSPGFIPAPDFLEGIYAGGGGDAMDAISLHAYPEPGDATARSAIHDVEDVLRVRDQHGGSAPLWVTETGLTTTGPYAVNSQMQSYTIVQLVERLQEIEQVAMILLHTLVEPPRGPVDRETGFGTVGQDGRPKPAYCALGALWADDPPC